MKLTTEEQEELDFLFKHPGFKYFMGLVDEIVQRIQQEVVSIPLEDDPQAASFLLYGARMKAVGAIAVRNALQAKISTLKYKQEGDKR